MPIRANETDDALVEDIRGRLEELIGDLPKERALTGGDLDVLADGLGQIAVWVRTRAKVFMGSR